MDAPGEEYNTCFADVARELTFYPVTCDSCRCAGEGAFAFLKTLVGDLRPLYAGRRSDCDGTFAHEFFRKLCFSRHFQHAAARLPQFDTVCA